VCLLLLLDEKLERAVAKSERQQEGEKGKRRWGSSRGGEGRSARFLALRAEKEGVRTYEVRVGATERTQERHGEVEERVDESQPTKVAPSS
jgi:hypothetical protein